jgi:hypothetical protein
MVNGHALRIQKSGVGGLSWLQRLAAQGAYQRLQIPTTHPDDADSAASRGGGDSSNRILMAWQGHGGFLFWLGMIVRQVDLIGSVRFLYDF